ncbi:hypothetical protein [Marinoscillum pacificum]|uniref:hypothetical protein n=1 Tax=Marinoscillum pacificum TaxID=392723 RepID=UPI00215806C0|nr:hypothetical protein [Marinoscillum pacificum]
MNLRTYLITKKIDPDLLKKAEPEKYKEFNLQFSQMHPDSFTAQKLFLLNKLRRKFKLEKEPEEKTIVKPKSVKPKIVPKIKK